MLHALGRPDLLARTQSTRGELSEDTGRRPRTTMTITATSSAAVIATSTHPPIKAQPCAAEDAEADALAATDPEIAGESTPCWGSACPGTAAAKATNRCCPFALRVFPAAPAELRPRTFKSLPL